jgi:transposase
MRGRPKALLKLSEAEREQLETLSKQHPTTRGMALRAQILLACAEGVDNKLVAARFQITTHTVSKWRWRFVTYRLNGLFDSPRAGAPRIIDDACVDAVIAKTIESACDGGKQWSTRTLASHMSLSQTAISRIWREYGLQSHRRGQVEILTDPSFGGNIVDIVGLYLDLPLKTIVLCVDKNSQAHKPNQTTAPRLPALGRIDGEWGHWGALSLAAELIVATDENVEQLPRSVRGEEFLRFMRAIASNAQPHLDVHIVIDAVGAHRVASIAALLKEHPRFHVHFTPTSASWPTLVDRWFVTQAERLGESGAGRVVGLLRETIVLYLEKDQKRARPFMWNKSAEDIQSTVEYLSAPEDFPV